MDSAEHGGDEPNGKIITIYSDFMMRIAKFDELVSTGSRFLVSFHQALGFLQRDPIDRASKLVERIMKAHESRRVASYFEAGCGNSHDSVQNVSKSKVVVEELECLLGTAASSVQTSKEKDGDTSCDLDSCIASSVLTEKEKEKEEDSSCDSHLRSISTDNISRTKCTHLQERPNAADYGSMMAIVYSMVKQDYTMQVRIVSSLNHKSSQGELETYCQMWNLRPFVDDEIMQKAWYLVPGR